MSIGDNEQEKRDYLREQAVAGWILVFCVVALLVAVCGLAYCAFFW